ncbi:MAG: signal peptidase II [Bacilli bacterium]|nr:signal peptidase II [Bacilli bacterium]
MNRHKLFLIILMVILVDQLSKYFISNNMHLYETINVIPNFFNLYYIQNDGGAFSILEGHMFLFYLVSIIGLVILYFIYKQANTNILKIAVAFVVGGLFGNLIDRVFYQKVIDFISLNFGSYHFAIFNVADIFITVGIILLLIDTLFINKKKEN